MGAGRVDSNGLTVNLWMEKDILKVGWGTVDHSTTPAVPSGFSVLYGPAVFNVSFLQHPAQNVCSQLGPEHSAWHTVGNLASDEETNRLDFIPVALIMLCLGLA